MSSRRSPAHRAAAVRLLVVGSLAALALAAACAAPGPPTSPQAGSARSHRPVAGSSPGVTPTGTSASPGSTSGSTPSPSAAPSRTGAARPTRHSRVAPHRLPATRVPEVRDRDGAAGGGSDGRGAGGKVVALTFDDGPGPYTRRVLRALQREHVRATFFEIGQQVAAEPGLSRELSRAGMSVQSHTWDHADLERMSPHAVHREDVRTSRAIAAATGRRPACLRPPYGAVDQRVQRRLARDGLTAVTWDVDSEDWTRPGARRIAARTLHTVHPGSVILLHDGGGDRSQTVRAVPRIVSSLRARGYAFTTLCD